MKWLNNLENFAKTQKVRRCPYCNSNNTDYSAKAVIDDMGYITMWCNDCKHSHFISRVKITDTMDKEKTIPNDLI